MDRIEINFKLHLTVRSLYKTSQCMITINKTNNNYRCILNMKNNRKILNASL